MPQVASLNAAQHAYVIEVGRIAVEGPAAELATKELIRQSYLGY